MFDHTSSRPPFRHSVSNAFPVWLVVLLALGLVGCNGARQGQLRGAGDLPASTESPADGETDAPATQQPGTEAEAKAVDVADIDAFQPDPAERERAVDVTETPFEGQDVADALFTGEEISRSPLDEIGEVEVDQQPPADDVVAPIDLPVTYDLPMVTNEKVEFWIDYYTRRHKQSFLPGMRRSGQYIDMFRRIFEEEGLPQDIVYMAHVESAFKVTAYSRARARGIWQFIASTGRYYGLEIDYWIDERSDPEKAARSAAAYLKKLYGDFGDWYLALAAYNGGEGRIRRALARTGAQDFWELARTRHIRRETRNYVPAILAAIQIYKDPERFGMEYTPDAPVEYETITVDGAADLQVLARCAGREFTELRMLNPALRRQQTPPSRSFEVNVPVGTGDRLLAELAKIPSNDRILFANHKVRRGDTLSDIAAAYGVTVRAIQQANGMGRRTMIRAGQTLKVPGGAAASVGAVTVAAGGEYEVRSGDTLWAIAQRHGTTAQTLAAVNEISVQTILYPGQSLRVPGGNKAGARASRSASGSAPVTHRVRRGDTLYDLARKHRTSAKVIAALNGISTRSVLRVGQRLDIAPGARTVAEARRAGETPRPSDGSRYTVRRGDSLWSIASLFGTTVDKLCRMNRISKQAVLHPGTVLQVP